MYVSSASIFMYPTNLISNWNLPYDNFKFLQTMQPLLLQHPLEIMIVYCLNLVPPFSKLGNVNSL